jgi:hypothetical protein
MWAVRERMSHISAQACTQGARGTDDLQAVLRYNLALQVRPSRLLWLHCQRLLRLQGPNLALGRNCSSSSSACALLCQCPLG